jgi:hypothetical protein
LSPALLNVGFAALLGAILATMVAKMSKRALYVTAACIVVLAFGFAVFAFREAAIDRAQSDEKNAEELVVLYPRDTQIGLTKYRNAALNWRLALCPGEATRIETQLQLQPAQHFAFTSASGCPRLWE